MHAFDRQTDRRTDRIPIAIPRLHSMQRGKNLPVFYDPYPLFGNVLGLEFGLKLVLDLKLVLEQHYQVVSLISL